MSWAAPVTGRVRGPGRTDRGRNWLPRTVLHRTRRTPARAATGGRERPGAGRGQHGRSSALGWECPLAKGGGPLRGGRAAPRGRGAGPSPHHPDDLGIRPAPLLVAAPESPPGCAFHAPSPVERTPVPRPPQSNGSRSKARARRATGSSRTKLGYVSFIVLMIVPSPTH